MAVDGYWQSMGLDGGSAQGYAGVETRPYTRLSEGGASMAQKVLDDAALIFPEFDGVVNKAAPPPANFANPDFAAFANWHTAHQVQFLKEQSPAWAAGDFRAVTFGSSGNAAENQTFVLSADGQRVYFVNTLMPVDVAKMPLEDQERLADLPAFRALISNPQGWWPADGLPGEPPPPATVAEARERIEADFLGPLEQLIKGSPFYDDTRRGEVLAAGNLGELYHNLFLDQIDMLRQRLAKMAVFDPNSVGLLVKDWRERFQRIERFATVTAQQTSGISGLTAAVNSLDNLAGVGRGLKVFLRSELRLRDLMDGSNQIVFSGTFNGQVTDTPMMVFLLQTQKNNAAEAAAQAKSEELNEMKALVQIYTKIQQLVNETMQKFDPVAFGAVPGRKETDEEKIGFLGRTGVIFPPPLTAEQKIVLSMFETSLAKANNNTFHPLETVANAPRPTFDFVGSDANMFIKHSQTEWDLFSQNLSKTSKVLSADSQARMDEINRISRGKNRNYELASETLNRMTDILRSIVN